MDIDDDDDVTAKAYASISAQLAQFTSPRLGTPEPIQQGRASPASPAAKLWQMDAMDWWQQELKEGGESSTGGNKNTNTTARGGGMDVDDDNDNPATPVKTPATRRKGRTSLLERAQTPVMSNSSQKEKKRGLKQPFSLGGLSSSSRRLVAEGDDDDDDAPMAPVQTPFKAGAGALTLQQRSSPFRSTLSGSPGVLTSSSYHVYKRHHDALYNFVKAKRSLNHRMDLEQQHLALTEQSGSTAASAAAVVTHSSSSLASQETRAEVDWLNSLASIGFSTDDFEEGNCWVLLACLRRLGLSALIWDNDSVSASQHTAAQTVYLQQLASQVEKTPQELIQELTGVGSKSTASVPLVLKRKYQLLLWMEECLNQVVPPAPKPVSSVFGKPNAVNIPDLMAEISTTLQNNPKQDKPLLDAALALIMAGKMEDALDLARSHGQAWRAASWSGGEPHGYNAVVDAETNSLQLETTGNPNRALWKQQMWKTGRHLMSTSSATTASFSSNPNASPEEAAICSLLANDTTACLQNPSFQKSWFGSLYALWFGVIGRMEDELLHWHNDHRRTSATDSLPYPGTEFVKHETEQLRMTSGLAGMSEAQVVQQLQTSSSAQSWGFSKLQACMAAFMVGKTSILNYCQSETANLPADLSTETAVQNLRFLTHLLLYLDSLQVGITPITLHGITAMKDQLVFKYVQYLASRPDLWQFLTVYISIMPEPRILQFFPKVLAKMRDEGERQHILDQIQDLLPQLEIRLLRQVVRLSIRRPAVLGQNTLEEDERECHSIGWLLQSDGHLGDALICANILLRGFFLDLEDDKMEVAMLFVQEYLPGDLVKNAGETKPQRDTMPEEEYTRQVENAITEHLAFLEYLDAYQTFNKWKDMLASASTTTGTALPDLNMARLNSTEKSIAEQHRVKEFVRNKRESCRVVVQAAEQAKKVLLAVLTHLGGWLAIEDQANGPEDVKRQRELETIRSRYLVLAVQWYHSICEETALWLTKSLDESASVGLTRKETLNLLRNEAMSPNYWYQHALDLAVLVADDSHSIHEAFKPQDLQELLSKLAETAISKLMNS
ncbi:MAG: hypothetical protein SGBAC_001447 [Bacillariaceae sp.]